VDYTHLDASTSLEPETSIMSTLDHRAVAARILRAIANAQAKGRSLGLDELAARIAVRRADVRDVVSRLHEEGHVDALRLRLTMSGLALAASMRACKLAPVRAPEAPSSSARVA
jgi:DNA-binding IclR family transcriptional regulator